MPSPTEVDLSAGLGTSRVWILYKHQGAPPLCLLLSTCFAAKQITFVDYLW